MTVTSILPTRDQRITGVFNYLKPSVRHSLYRNGEVLTRRDQDGSDAGMEGVDIEEQEVLVQDARRLDGSDRCTIETNGFDLLTCSLVDSDIDFLLHDQVTQHYYLACVNIVQQVTGAVHVVAFDYNVRSAAGKSSKKQINGGQQVQSPGHFVHGDYTLTSAPQRLRDLAQPPGKNDTLRSILSQNESLLSKQEVAHALEGGGRWAIINVWRNIAEEPVVSHPLALCDAQSVDPKDLVVFEIHYPGRVGENYFSKYSSGHNWYYYPSMTRDEALLIKQWDSAGELARTSGTRGDAMGEGPCTFSFHSAFVDPTTPPDAPERWSIEVRCIALYE